MSLFHADGAQFYAVGELPAQARREVEQSPLIRRAAAGDRAAAVALHIGFWPFVRAFELAIDKQTLPREPLYWKFGGG